MAPRTSAQAPKRKNKKNKAIPLRPGTRWCKWCKQHRPFQRFDLHEQACHRKHDEEQSLAEPFTQNPEPLPLVLEAPPSPSVSPVIPLPPFPLEALAQPVLLPFPNNNHSISSTVTNLPNNPPERYIRIEYHPRRNKLPDIINLDAPSLLKDESHDIQPAPDSFSDSSWYRPWAPFACRADFEAAELIIQTLMKDDSIDRFLSAISSPKSPCSNITPGYQQPMDWLGSKSKITLKSAKDFHAIMGKAKHHILEWKKSSVTLDVLGKDHKYEFFWREPMTFMEDLVTDPSLMDGSSFHPVTKILVQDGKEVRLIDEPFTATMWHEIENSLPPDCGGIEHCFLPFHLWLDKGNITRNVQMHPIVLRGAWLSSSIRNSSGNGGGILIGFMPIFKDPRETKDQSAPIKLALSHARSKLYQRVLATIFERTIAASRGGSINRCGDGITRICYPGLGILSLDMLEAWSFLGCRSTNANFPFPKCLAPYDNMKDLICAFPQRTIKTMKAAYCNAQNAPSRTSREECLKAFGIHNVELFSWDFRFCNPYECYRYDVCHSDDLGVWGKHLWKYLLDVLEVLNLKPALNTLMKNHARWPGLKHFDHVATIEFTDAQQYFDILKGILPGIANLLGPNSALVHCIRAYQRFRMMVGMKVMTTDRLERLRLYLQEYDSACQLLSVTGEAGLFKNFSFPKQHAKAHAPDDILRGGTTPNFSTRTGEGMHQEVRQAYLQTNWKNVQEQLTRADAYQEVISFLRMLLDAYDEGEARAQDAQRRAETCNLDSALSSSSKLSTKPTPNSLSSDPLDSHGRCSNYELKSPERRRLTSDEIQDSEKANPIFAKFDTRLREYFANYISNEDVGHSIIKIIRYSRLDLFFQSLEDFREARDIVRCHAKFHGRMRHDCVFLNTEDVKVAQVEGLFRCILASGVEYDIALVRALQNSTWRPLTAWQGCSVVEAGDSMFVSPQYFIRRACLTDTGLDKPPGSCCYVEDAIDNDMFLRMGN